ncbi:UBN2_2 domain-containing protein [Tanacetum coccineum]
MDLDHALRIDPPAALTAERTSKAHASTLILKMLTSKYDGVSGVREHIMMMSDMANKLKGMEISEEEERLKVEKPDVVHVTTTNSNKRKGSWKSKGSSGDNSTPNKVQKTDTSTSSFQGGPKCKFCHKKGHTQKDCPKFKEWLAKKDTVMSSDLASSEVTYTSISSHGDPLAWAVDFFRLQEPDSPEAAPASPDYVPGPEEPEQAPLSPDYVPRPEYPEYLAPSDEEVLAEDQPYVVAYSPIALSLGYVVDSDLEEDPEEDSENGSLDYPADGGDDDDDDSSDDDEEEEASEEGEAKEEEEEHLALADSVERLARCLAAPALLSSPLPIAPYPYGSPNHVRTPSGFRAAMGRLRASSPSTHHPLHPSTPLPPPPSSLHLPPHVPTSLPLPSSPLPPLLASLFIPLPVDRKEDTPEAELPPHKRVCLTALTLRYKVGESSTAAPRPTRGHGIDYGFISTLDAETRR